MSKTVFSRSLNSTIKCNSNTVCGESGAAVASLPLFQTKMRSPKWLQTDKSGD